MKNVWVVLRSYHYEGSSLEKVFGTRRSAEKYADKENQKIDNHYETLEVVRKRVCWS